MVIEADKNIIQTVIGNLFVNAIKFTPKQREINFQLHKYVDVTVTIEIEDNGIRYEPRLAKQHLRHYQSKHQTRY